MVLKPKFIVSERFKPLNKLNYSLACPSVVHRQYPNSPSLSRGLGSGHFGALPASGSTVSVFWGTMPSADANDLIMYGGRTSA